MFAWDPNSYVIKFLIGPAPVLLACVWGAIWSMVNASRPRRVRLSVGIAMAVLWAGVTVVPLVLPSALSYVWNSLERPTGFFSSGIDPRWILIHDGTESLVAAGALSLLLWAGFTRDDPPPESSDAVT